MASPVPLRLMIWKVKLKSKLKKIDIIGDEGHGDAKNNNDILGVYGSQTLFLYIYQAVLPPPLISIIIYFLHFFMFFKKICFV